MSTLEEYRERIIQRERADMLATIATLEEELQTAEEENERLRARSYWVECPACTDSSSIRCVCGFHSDGPAFLREEETP